MESGNQKAGLGSIQWWGFSPATDLVQYAPKRDQELNVLLVGPGDIRHLLRTISENPDRKVNFYIYEPQVESIARHLLLLLDSGSNFYHQILWKTEKEPIKSRFWTNWCIFVTKQDRAVFGHFWKYVNSSRKSKLLAPKIACSIRNGHWLFLLQEKSFFCRAWSSEIQRPWSTWWSVRFLESAQRQVYGRYFGMFCRV